MGTSSRIRYSTAFAAGVIGIVAAGTLSSVLPGADHGGSASALAAHPARPDVELVSTTEPGVPSPGDLGPRPSRSELDMQQHTARQQAIDAHRSDARDAAAWEADTRKALNHLNSSLKDLTDALDAQDVGQIHDACVGVADAGKGLDVAVDAPVGSASDAFQAAVDDFTAAGSQCEAIGSGSSKADVQNALATIKSGMNHVHEGTSAVANAS